MELPEEYIVQKFYQFAGYPKYNKSTNTYSGGCPICLEGSSWKRKSRLYYIVKDVAICCHNCGWYSKPPKWIMEVADFSYEELRVDVESGDFEYGIQDTLPERVNVHDLPRDSINLFDKTQVQYYKDNDTVRKVISTVVDRRLNTATNRPRALYLSLDDFVHKNRLILPFYDSNNKCIFYQSRGVLDKCLRERPKYLSKQNSDKSLFNYDNISSDVSTIYIVEGPIDSFFIKNSVGVAGIQERSSESLTTLQKQMLNKFFLAKKVWVLDSQWQDQASLKKTKQLIDSDECVFIWPEKLGKRYKDINEMCVDLQLDEVDTEVLEKFTYCGLKASIKLNRISV